MMRNLVNQMLAMIDRGAWSADGGDQRFDIAIADARLCFDEAALTTDLTFEQLAAAIEATIAAERVCRMIEAVGVGPQMLPLWLVSGSDILAKWLVWAGARNALRKVLMVSEAVSMAPVVGYLDRRSRRELGQGGARIRVRGGMATAERIELSDDPRCIATIGEHAHIRIEKLRLPETLILVLQPDIGSSARRPLAEIISHPFFAAAGLRIIGVANEETSVIFEVESHWAPLEPMPDAALAVLPADSDPAFPWRATAAERSRLNGLVEQARHHVVAKLDPR